MKSALLLSSALVLLVPAFPSYAQGVSDAKPNTRAGRRAQAEAEAKAKGKTSATAPTALYPQASRENPEASGAAAVHKLKEKLIELQGADDKADEAIAKADEILANPKSNAFDKSTAAYVAGAAWQGKDTESYTNAIKYYQMAIDNNGLHNNIHYRAMLQLAQMQAAEGHNAEALKLVDRFLAETKSADETATRIKTQILVAMDKPMEAAVLMEKFVAEHPDDKKAMLNLAAMYVASNQDAKAGAIFDKMRAGGLLTESKDYDTAFRLLANIEGREKDAMAFIDEGLKKGILQPSYEMYSFQGRSYYQANDVPKALEAWSKGAPLAKDGEMYLNVAKLQLDGDHWAAAKEAAQQAKGKGVKRQGDVWQVIARAENGLGNAAASKAALQEAAKYPETQKWAEAALRQGLAK
jgi:predicted Zn-dependent protease